MTWYYQLFVVHYGTYTQFVNNDCMYAPNFIRNTSLTDRVLVASDIGRMRHHRLSDLQSRASLQAEWKEQMGLDSHHTVHVSLLPLVSCLLTAYNHCRLGDIASVTARQAVVNTHPDADVPMVSRATYIIMPTTLTSSLSDLIPTPT
jgi:hypothetical protein